MHAEAWEFLSRNLAPFRDRDVAVLELGSLNINGSCRELFAQPRIYWGVDLQAGAGVDEIADATTWQHTTMCGQFDIAISSEVFEHLRDWRLIVNNAYAHLNDTGIFVCTAASDGRPAHSAKGGGAPIAVWQNDHAGHPLDAVEWYQNIGRHELEDALRDAGFVQYRIEQRADVGDVYAIATRGPELPSLTIEGG
ncbi:MAG: methyltransferase domain-containing protein [Ilumatobacteraceae bacterium]